MRASQKRDEQFRDYLRETVGTREHTSTDELVKLAELRKHGDISDVEYQQAKAKILA